MLLLSEKVKVLNLKGKNKLYVEVAEVYSKNKSLICKIVQQEEEIRVSFAVTPRIAELWLQCMLWLVKMEKALCFLGRDTNRKLVPTDGNMLCQKTQSIQEDFSKGSLT